MNNLKIKNLPLNEQVDFIEAVLRTLNPSQLDSYLKAWKENGIRDFTNWSK